MAAFLELMKYNEKLTQRQTIICDSASFLFRVHSRLSSVQKDVADNLLSTNTPILQ